MTPEDAAKLRSPFPASMIGKLPKAGIKLDYVGHAGVTDRLLSVDPEWTWEPMATNEFGLPLITAGGLWIRMTVCGVTRPGFGDGPDIKQMISDAIRNAAMRFGVALDLWSKEDLHATQNAEAGHGGGVTGTAAAGSGGGHSQSAGGVQGSRPSPASATSPRGESTPAAAAGPDTSHAGPAVSKSRRDALKARCVALQADGVSVADAREAVKLPLVDSCNAAQLEEFEMLVETLEAKLTAPFVEVPA